jgi:Rps23 Pro-64 3,4-dihydroxylase Tpa1-like proline 4-hydroxylase
MYDDVSAAGTSAMPLCFAEVFSPAECRELIAEIDAAHHEPARTWNGSEFAVLPEGRSGRLATLTVETEARVQDRVWELTPQLARRYDCEVTHLSAITALVYDRGDHFAAHSDGGDGGGPPEVRRRRVSLVVALNDGAGDFSGGELNFYPECTPADAPRAGQVVAVRSEPGLVIAFASPMTHQVMPVLTGRRYSLALWALAPE